MTGETEKNQVEGRSPTQERKKRRRWPWILAGVLVLLCVLVALLPTILSTGMARQKVLGRVSQGLNGSVDASSWSLGWFSGLTLNDISVKEAGGGPVFEADAVSIGASVPMLLGSHKKLGTITVQGPRVTLSKGPDGRWNFADLVPPGPEKKKEAKALPFDISGDLNIKDGTIVVQQPGSPPLEVTDVNVTASVKSVNEPVEYTIDGKLPGTGGSVTAKGTATLMENRMVKPEALKAEMKLIVDKLKLDELGKFGPKGQVPLSASGLATARVDATVNGINDVTASGNVSLASLVLSGGSLSKDTPSFDQASLEF